MIIVTLTRGNTVVNIHNDSMHKGIEDTEVFKFIRREGEDGGNFFNRRAQGVNRTTETDSSVSKYA
jgi:hypothetical protein